MPDPKEPHISTSFIEHLRRASKISCPLPDQDISPSSRAKPSTSSSRPLGHQRIPDPPDESSDALRLIKQPETRPISQEQLVAEVKGIYAGLLMVESKCIEVDNAQSSQADTKLNNEQWQALIALHRTLLHEHHDFFLASQHPSASQALRRLASKYAMPAEWHIKGEVNGHSVDALADTGANVNAISKDEADRLGLVPDPGSASKRIRLPSGKTCPSLGTANLAFNFNGEKTVHLLRCNIVEKLEYSMIVCYDFLRKTETLTRFFKKRIKEVARSSLHRFSLCLLEDDAASDEIRARMDGFINGAPVRAVPDTGSGIMALSASYARRLGLQVDTTRRTHVTFADGSSAMTSGVVKATWNFLPPDPYSGRRAWLDDGGRAASADWTKWLVVSSDAERNEAQNDDKNDNTWDYEWEYEWHIIEDLPVDAILSIDFIRRHDVFGRHEHAFVCAAPRAALLAEIFGILNSPNPFAYNMVVRESARQSEIQRKIQDLPREARATQRMIEQGRIDSWNRIKDARENGEDWSRLRDEYLSSLRLQPAQLSWPQHPPAGTYNAPKGRNNARARGAWRSRWRWRNL
ncbi:hypothetical protein F4823DRAFT_566300 [Ustulina deusta]|nr:hypothetical protein F4823DRAFT_566300 [Ustulina deusta]